MFNDSRKVQENNNEYLPFIHILNILYISFKLSRSSLYTNLTLRNTGKLLHDMQAQVCRMFEKAS